MEKVQRFEIRILHRKFDGAYIRVLGDGRTPNDALKDASELLFQVFRPKQDGRPPDLTPATLVRPDGSMYSLTKDEIRLLLADND